MNIFDIVKKNITARQAAERYGLKPDRNGLIKCPFHNERTASMKVDKRYYCFGCGATGDAVDLTEMLFGLKPITAAKKLAEDFALIECERRKPDRTGTDKVRIEKERAIQNADRKKERTELSVERDICSYKKEIVKATRVYMDYRIILEELKNKYAPKRMSDDWSEQFEVAVHQLSLIRYNLEILVFGNDEDRISLLEEKRGEVEILEKYCKRYRDEKNRECAAEDGTDGID